MTEMKIYWRGEHLRQHYSILRLVWQCHLAPAGTPACGSLIEVPRHTGQHRPVLSRRPAHCLNYLPAKSS